MIFNPRSRFIWPHMREQIKQHMEGCTICPINQPSKAIEKKQGLTTRLTALKPLDWIVIDIGEQVNCKGVKQKYLAICDRFSGFISCFTLKGTKTSHVI